MTLSRSQNSDLLDRHGLGPSRALGQNFLCDRGTIDKIVRLAGVEPGQAVVEIGPGLGSLTTGLLEAGADVLAVEIDRYLIPALAEVTEPWAGQAGTSLPDRLRIVEADATEVDWDDLLDDTPMTVVANLPYNIATPLILDLLASEPRFTRWLVMVQREAGERLCAGPGSKTYGIPSVLVAYWGEARLVGTVRPEVFLPRPKVDSVLVAIERSPQPRVDADIGRLSHLVRTGFGQRRKMLRRSLSGVVTEADLVAAGVEPTDRPERLSVEDWARLATVVP
ncbi:MAG: 16S rRNA (adenine(1518)-N(6)/adenine(1519)-N(6))-dimethyltransferase RsmA [Actinomycetota bacterium]